MARSFFSSKPVALKMVHTYKLWMHFIQHRNVFGRQFKALSTNGGPCKDRMDEQIILPQNSHSYALLRIVGLLYIVFHAIYWR